MTDLKGIQVYYDPHDDITPPFYAVDCDYIWERLKHVEFTPDERCCIEELVENRYGMLHRHRMIACDWSERGAIEKLKLLLSNPCATVKDY